MLVAYVRGVPLVRGMPEGETCTSIVAEDDQGVGSRILGSGARNHKPN